MRLLLYSNILQVMEVSWKTSLLQNTRQAETLKKRSKAATKASNLAGSDLRRPLPPGVPSRDWTDRPGLSSSTQIEVNT